MNLAKMLNAKVAYTVTDEDLKGFQLNKRLSRDEFIEWCNDNFSKNDAQKYAEISEFFKTFCFSIKGHEISFEIVD